ncbi:MAG TPA: 50S ribosomal protein L9 [Oscillospiraceae bacterium]|nr:50S ribosomal protein L9 [Oscillospiraceae bacterium]
MKVILLKNVKGLGEEGEVVDVKDGYARNYLLPKKLVVEATEGNLRTLESQKASQKIKEQQEVDEAKNLVAKLEESPIEITAKAGEGGKLFGSITSIDLAEALEEQHKIKIDRRKIILSEPIKELGIMDIDVKLYTDVVGKLKVNIKGE